MRIRGPLDLQLLERAGNEVIKRHEGLRTAFTKVKGRLVQLIVRSLSVSLPVLDLRHLPQAEQTTEDLSVALEYSTELFDSGTITRLLHHLQAILVGIVANPVARLSELPLLSAEERKEILEDWGVGPRPAKGDWTAAHELFEAHARRPPSPQSWAHVG